VTDQGHLPRIAQPRAGRSSWTQLGIPFDEIKLRRRPDAIRDVVEEALDGEPRCHYVERIARTKASTGWKRMQERGLPLRPVLGAIRKWSSTTRSSASRTTPTPRARCLEAVGSRARSALRRRDPLPRRHRGRGVGVAGDVPQLTAGEIERYIETREPFDKAGGYGRSRDARAAFVSAPRGQLLGRSWDCRSRRPASLLARIGRSVL
jgi:septum formation protein